MKGNAVLAIMLGVAVLIVAGRRLDVRFTDWYQYQILGKPTPPPINPNPLGTNPGKQPGPTLNPQGGLLPAWATDDVLRRLGINPGGK